MIENFHFLRPAWLLALIPLLWLLWQGLHRNQTSRSWRSVVDARLLPHLLKGRSQDKKKWLSLLLAICGLLSIIALAGPVWERLPQPIYNQQSALVIALDMSRSMDVGDVRPSRLIRARHKIADLLSARKEGQTALVSYASEAFVVTPLTEDNATITALLPGLLTEIMPAQGSRADKAVSQALALFANSGITQGDILLVTDGVGQMESDNLRALLRQNRQFRLSILAVGTEDGGPIPLASGGFLKDDDGAIVIPRLALLPLAQLAEAGGGELQRLVASDADIQSLAERFETVTLDNNARKSELSADLWREQGPWLLMPVILLVAMMFRRGLILALVVFVLPMPPKAEAFDWAQLWRNDDQRASQAFEKGNHQAAAELFQHNDWKASSLYRAEDYEQALQYWRNGDGDDALYNQGNTLARLGKFEEAIAAYDRVLENNPDHDDAAFNRKQIEDFLKQQQQQQQQDSQQNAEQSQQDQSDQQNNDQSRQDQSQQSGDEGAEAEQNQSSSQQNEPQDRDEPEQSNAGQADNRQSPQHEEQSTQTVQQELEQQMSEQAAEQWLRKIPDDPGGLLRRKFLYQYRQRSDIAESQQPW